MRAFKWELALVMLQGKGGRDSVYARHMPFANAGAAADYLRRLPGQDHGLDAERWDALLRSLGHDKLMELSERLTRSG